jgi:hypothetical protein
MRDDASPGGDLNEARGGSIEEPGDRFRPCGVTERPDRPTTPDDLGPGSPKSKVQRPKSRSDA